MNTMWALDDFTEHNGATLVWPGTQIRGDSKDVNFTPKETHTSVLTPDRSAENRQQRTAHAAPQPGGQGFESGYAAVQKAIVDADVKPIKATMSKGSVMIYKGSLLHGGGMNTTTQPRMGVILEYCAGWLRPQENHLLAVPREIAAAVSPKLQELLGCEYYYFRGCRTLWGLP
jgi:ectoine hydroxylase-related dioxygenase (phytanoyl-CoA dioxygenase family)